MKYLPRLMLTAEGNARCRNLLRRFGNVVEFPRVSPFLAWVDFHARSRFARSTIPEEKWGTTRSLLELGVEPGL